MQYEASMTEKVGERERDQKQLGAECLEARQGLKGLCCLHVEYVGQEAPKRAIGARMALRRAPGTAVRRGGRDCARIP